MINISHSNINYVDVIARKILISVGILFKLSKYLPLEIIKTLYYSLINPFFLYGIEVWHGTYANVMVRCEISNKLPIVLMRFRKTLQFIFSVIFKYVVIIYFVICMRFFNNTCHYVKLC